MIDKVIVATVTYNSSNFLERLVEAVALQKYPVDKVVVIDNASSEEHRKAICELALRYAFLEVVRSSQNLGGAGGFEKGIKHILDMGYEFDWIWIMDDDAFPAPNCLEELLKYKSLENLGALCPLIYGTELKKYQLTHHKRMSRYLDKDCQIVASVEMMPPVVEIETNAFVGPLVKRQVVLEVGTPDGSLFIYGDDTEYMYRISRKYSVYLIKAAIINHRDVKEQLDAINPNSFWKEYYKFRNRMLLVDKYASSNRSKMFGKAMVAKEILRNILATVLKRKYGQYRKLRLWCLAKGLADGLRGKTGKTVDPALYRRKIGEA